MYLSVLRNIVIKVYLLLNSLIYYLLNMFFKNILPSTLQNTKKLYLIILHYHLNLYLYISMKKIYKYYKKQYLLLAHKASVYT